MKGFIIYVENFLPNLVEVMRKSICTIANDSGSVHVAGVSCQKVISLHGPTPFRETGPYGNGKNKIIEATINMKCSPCFKTEVIKKCPSNLCMINLSEGKQFSDMLLNKLFFIDVSTDVF